MRQVHDFETDTVPKDNVQEKALGIIRKALAQTNRLGISEIAFGGCEHLVAIGAPLDPKQKGLMLYMLRYEDELRVEVGAFGRKRIIC